jgi:hypothetical protein
VSNETKRVMKYSKKVTMIVGTAAISASLMMGAPASATEQDDTTPGTLDVVKHRTRTGTSVAPLSDPRLCPVDDVSVPEAAGGGVVTEWLSYGQSLTVEPYGDQIWAGVWFTGWNGPAGWPGTVAGWDYPAPGQPRYSLIARLGSGPYQYVGAAPRTFTNTTPGYLQRVRFKVNDNSPGNGAGAFQVFLRYPCH